MKIDKTVEVVAVTTYKEKKQITLTLSKEEALLLAKLIGVTTPRDIRYLGLEESVCAELRAGIYQNWDNLVQTLKDVGVEYDSCKSFSGIKQW